LIEHFKYLRKTGEWVPVYFDDRNVVYVRNIPENKQLIERDGYLVLHPVLTLENKGIDSQDIPQYIKECKRSMEANPSLILPRLVLQNIYLAQGELKEAASAGEEMIKIEPQNARWYILLGETYLRMGDMNRARALYQKAVEIDPEAEPFVRKKLSQMSAR
jgi:tetratricopeptide (TPR) repeat protein